MSEYSKTFLLEEGRKREAGAKISLAAFGKHPGWNDHVEDLGLETPSLILAKTILYIQGIGGQIDAGVWEKLDPAQQLAGFNHFFLWRRGAQFLLGKMWSSSDGKGRTRYPMILCAHCSGMPLAWAVKNIGPQLDEIQKKCVATNSAEEVKAILARATADLRGRIASLAAVNGPLDPSLAERKAFVDSSVLGPDRLGLNRVVHQISSQMAAYSRDTPGTRTADLRPQQIRLPRSVDAVTESLLLWDQVFQIMLLPGTPMLLIASLDQPWMDATVGEPSTHEFMCLRATDKNIPPASAIPYTLDASTKGRTQKVVEMLLADPAKQAPEPPGPKPGPVSGLTSFFIKAKSKWLMIVASLCILLVVIIAAMILTSRKSSPSAAAQATQAQAKADADAKAHDEARLAAEKEKLAAESKAKVDADAASEQAKAKAEQDRLAAAQKAKADADAKVTEEAKQKAEQDRLIAEANAKAQAEAKASEEARQKAEKEQLAAEEKAKADAAARQQAEQERIVAEANAKALAESKAAEEARVKAEQEQLAIQAKADADAKAKVAEEARLASERELAAAQAKAKAEADAKTLAQARIESDQTKLVLVVKPAEAVPAAQAAQSTPGQNPAPGTGGGINLDNSAGIKFAWVAGMPDAKGPVAVGVYEITQGEYTDVMQTNPSQYHDGPATLPVESVTGDNAVQFCAKLTEREHTKHTLDSNWKYTLPTENQWRYFAKDTPIMDAVTSRFRPVSDLRGHPEPVGGSRKPNPLGLRDVVGNVSEWCYGVDGKLEAIGGAYDTRMPSLTAPALALDPASASNNVGFRIIVSPVAP